MGSARIVRCGRKATLQTGRSATLRAMRRVQSATYRDAAACFHAKLRLRSPAPAGTTVALRFTGDADKSPSDRGHSAATMAREMKPTMRRHRIVTVAALALAFIAGSRTAYAQERFEFKIPFSFVANGTTLPAGDYSLVTSDEAQVLTLESKSVKTDVVMMPVETRIQEFKPVDSAELVFDRLNDKSYVAGLLPPGADGYVVLVTKAKHTHHWLKGARVKK